MTTRMGYATFTWPSRADAQDEMRALLRLLHDEPVCAWLEDAWKPDGLCLRDDVTLDEGPSLMTGWPEGRLFTRRSDLRWEWRADASLHIVVVTDGELPKTDADPVALTPAGPASQVLLWGTRRDDGWREARIPNLARFYPDTWSGPNAAIVTQAYEAAWPDAPPGSVRRVTRYLAFDGHHTPTKLDSLQPRGLE